MLSMNSGLDDGVTDNHCTLPTCLQYKAAPETRWAYHNAPYTLLDSILQKASGLSLNAFTNQVVETKTGINGIWYRNGWNNVYFSNARSFARFGLLAQNNFIWNSDTILHDTFYKKQMITSSQNINPAYGYLWWLNGLNKYMLPQSQFVFNGPIAYDAPDDMIAAIGKNGQLLCVSKNEGLVLLRMGDTPGTGIEVPTEFCNLIWKNFNTIRCKTAIAKNYINQPQIKIWPNPAHDFLHVAIKNASSIKILNALGQTCHTNSYESTINIAALPVGVYFIQVETRDGVLTQKWIKQ